MTFQEMCYKALCAGLQIRGWTIVGGVEQVSFNSAIHVNPKLIEEMKPFKEQFLLIAHANFSQVVPASTRTDNETELEKASMRSILV